MIRWLAVRPLCTWLYCGALLLSSASVRAAAPLTLINGTMPVEVIRAGESLPLDADLPLMPGDRLVTGGRGRGSLRSGQAAMTLGADGELVVTGSEAAVGKSPALLLRLVRGVMRVDGGGGHAVDHQPSTALQLELGDLLVRLSGADVWMRIGDAGSVVCLLDGTVDIRSARGTRRLDTAGDCLVVDSGGQRVEQPEYAAMLERLALTEYARTGPSLDALAVSTVSPAEPPVVARQTPTVVATDGPRTGGWTLVALALGDAESARLEAQGLIEQGLPGLVRPFNRPDGRRVYRVTVGSFASRAQAQAYSDQIRQPYGLPQLWVAPY